jgi:hypothetical protein
MNRPALPLRDPAGEPGDLRRPHPDSRRTFCMDAAAEKYFT